MDMTSHRSEAIKDGRYLSVSDSVAIETAAAGIMEDRSPATWPARNASLPLPGATDVPAHERALEYHMDSNGRAALRQSAIPAPLAPKSAPPQATPLETSARRSTHTLNPPVRLYRGSASNIKKHFGVDDLAVDFSNLNQSYTYHPPQAPKKAWRSSLKRTSLTPSEIQYPINLLHTYDEEDGLDEADHMSGVRKVHIAPPVPPRDPRRTVGYPSTEAILPVYKHNEPLEEPLNGRTAWLHSLTGILVVFNCWGLNNAYGLFQAYYTTIYLPHTSPTAVAWIGSTQLALVFGLGVPVGRLVDKGYFRLVFHGGSAIMVLGLLLSSLCKSLGTLWLVNGLITGSGMGMCFCSGMVAMMTWFDERKLGLAMGLGATGSCVGGIVYVLFARHVLVTDGFKTTMLIIGAVAAITMIPPNLVFRVRGRRNMWLPEIRSHKASKQSNLNWRTFAEPSYLLAAAGMFFAFLGVYFGWAFIVLFSSTVLHLSDRASTNLLIFMLTANLPGRFLPGLISDRCIGPLNTIIPSVLLSSSMIWLWAASGESQGGLTVVACFYGFVSAGIQVLYAPTIYSFCLEPVQNSTFSNKEDKQVAMDRIGVKAGGIFTCVGLACLIGLPIGGALITYREKRGMSQPYLGAQVFAGVSLLLSGLLLLASRVKKSGWAARRA